MARPHPAPGKRRTQYGFTLVEMMISLVVGGIVMASVYQLLIGQSRSYTKQRELMNTHVTLRAAASLLAWELRQASAARGDLYEIEQEKIVLRSVQATGIVCAKHVTQPRYGLSRLAGDLQATADDSALVFRSGGADEWHIMRILQVATAGTLGVGNCDWPGTPAPDIALEVAVANVPSDTLGVVIGALFRSFRQVEYGLYEDAGDGRSWLGRKVGAAASYEKLAGPLQESGGLVLTYRDAAGNVTADPTQVAVIDFVLRAESYHFSGNAQQFERDTLATRVALRG